MVILLMEVRMRNACVLASFVAIRVMASRWKSRRSSPLRRSPLRDPLMRSPLRTPPRSTQPLSPLKTPLMARTPPLLTTYNHSPLKTPPLFSDFSPLPLSHTPPMFSDTLWRTEPNFHYDLRWISNLSPVATISSPPRLNIMVPAGVNAAIVPTTLTEVDQFLSSTWDNAYDTATSSEYSRKLSELHRFYTTKMWEIEEKEKKALAESLSNGNQPGPSALNTLGDCLADAEITQKYGELKRHVKEETVQAILKLNAKSPSPPKQSRQVNRPSPQQQASRGSPKQSRQGNKPSPCSSRQQTSQSPPKCTSQSRRSRSPQKSTKDSKTVDILNEWFDEHIDKPYPNKKEKEELARQCNMTIKQVSTWFNNKRYRSNCTLIKKGKGKGKGSK